MSIVTLQETFTDLLNITSGFQFCFSVFNKQAKRKKKKTRKITERESQLVDMIKTICESNQIEDKSHFPIVSYLRKEFDRKN